MLHHAKLAEFWLQTLVTMEGAEAMAQDNLYTFQDELQSARS